MKNDLLKVALIVARDLTSEAYNKLPGIEVSELSEKMEDVMYAIDGLLEEFTDDALDTSKKDRDVDSPK